MRPFMTRLALLTTTLSLTVCQTVSAGYISSNGEFETSWTYGTGASLSSASQSPFTNAFANNSKGAHVNAQTADGGVNQTFTTIPAATTGKLYMNVDFRNNDANTGYYSLLVGRNAGASASSVLEIRGNGVKAKSGGNMGNSLLTPTVGTWYNVQLTLDLDLDTYWGTITPYGGSSIAISTRNFVQSNTDINCILSSTYGNTVNCPDHDIDNFVLSNTSIPAPTIPEPGMLVMLGFALAGLLAYAWRKRK